jgi:hypothetical protein
MQKFELDIQAFTLELEEISHSVIKLDFEYKMLKNSLLRKIEYYTQKHQIVKDDIEKRNIEDIIETAEFDIDYKFKEYEREIKKLKLKSEYISIDINQIKFDNNVR